MKETTLKHGNLSTGTISEMNRCTRGAPYIALKASLDLCISVLSKNGFSLSQIGEYLNHQAETAISIYKQESEQKD